MNALDLLLPNPLIRHDGLTTLQVTVNEQPDKNRWIVHLLHYIPERRSQEIDIIEDVMSVPEQEPLAYEQKDGPVDFMVPQLAGHQMIALGLS